MHFEILIEDVSGQRALEILIPKIINLNTSNTYQIHSYKGIGQIPKNMTTAIDASKRQLLNALPKLLKGYGKTFAGYGDDYQATVIIVVDLDDKCLRDFRIELIDLRNTCDPKPNVKFCFAVEEGEAWFLGDIPAVKSAYSTAKNSILRGYSNDSICGTWELLADAIFPKGSAKLKRDGWVEIGKAKSEWAKNITPYMDVNNNSSPSFCYFRDKLKELEA